MEGGTSRLFSEIRNNINCRRKIVSKFLVDENSYDKAPAIAAILWHMISGMLSV